jgi:UDPglucose--hexose-1-phosphate uridylyltransferase
MPEYRYNLITDQWVIISGDRGKRPTDFQTADGPRDSDFDENCPFCPGQEKLTPPETYAIRPASTPPDSPGWSVRVVPNKFPALSPKDKQPHTSLPLQQHPGIGYHEVIIESPHHNLCMGHHDPDQAFLICQTLRDRYRYFADNFVPDCHSEPFASLKGKLREESHARTERLVTIFYNHGATSGASLSHPHFQLLTQSVIPPRLARQMQHCRQYQTQQNQSPFDAVIAAELDAAERILACTDDFIVFCPFASRTPFEIYLLPRFEQPHFEQLDDAKLKSFSEILQQTLYAMDKQLNYPDYNIAFHTAPLVCHSKRSEESMRSKSRHTQTLKEPVFEQSLGLEDLLSQESQNDTNICPGFRWYIQICPRVGITGGFELATDVFINTVPPESAANFFRG